MSKSLLEQLIASGLFIAISAIINFLLGNNTQRRANNIALQTLDLTKRNSELSEGRSMRDELRKDLEMEIKRADAEKARADLLASKLEEAREKWIVRMAKCERIGTPCLSQEKKNITDE